MSAITGSPWRDGCHVSKRAEPHVDTRAIDGGSGQAVRLPTTTGSNGALGRLVALFALMYAAFGVASPFMPAFFQARGLEHLGSCSAAALRFGSSPDRCADAWPTARRRFAPSSAVCTTLAALAALGLLPAHGFSALLMVSLFHAAALAPITTLADALALRAAAPRDGATRFEYGWVRGTGSAVFIAGTLLSGQVVGGWGLTSVVVLQAALLAPPRRPRRCWCRSRCGTRRR